MQIEIMNNADATATLLADDEAIGIITFTKPQHEILVNGIFTSDDHDDDPFGQFYCDKCDEKEHEADALHAKIEELTQAARSILAVAG
jgi:hypothetical protein